MPRADNNGGETMTNNGIAAVGMMLLALSLGSAARADEGSSLSLARDSRRAALESNDNDFNDGIYAGIGLGQASGRW